MDLEHLAERMITTCRGWGKTTAVAEAAKKTNGVVLCRDRKEAERIQREHGVKAVTIDDGIYEFSGRGPVYADPDAFGGIILEIFRKHREEINRINEVPRYGERLEKETLILEIEKRLEWLMRDIHEPDKVHCVVQGIRFEITKVWPNYLRPEKHRR